MLKKFLVLAICVLTVLGITSLGAALLSVSAFAKGKPTEVVPGSLQKFLFIHYKKGHKPQHNPGGNGKGDTATCSKLLGVKWKEFPISYVVHPDLEAKDPGAIFASAETWDASTSRELFSDTVTFDSTANFDDTADSRDGRNELSLGNWPEPGVIAVTVVWAGIPIGVKGGLRILEYDILFDTDFNWGDAGPTSETSLGNTSVMDLQNIATHEKGHGVGEDDVYDAVCSEVTMFGFSENGETKKRTLAPPDIAGLHKMYGA